jgi:hypothetical protein
MADEQQITGLRTYRNLGTQARRQVMQSLQTELLHAAPITPERLADWVKVSDDRGAFLTGSVWGGIRWPKAIGRPRTPGITGGFDIVHQLKDVKYVDGGSGDYSDIGAWAVRPAPSVWDATIDDGHYRVAFQFFAGLGIFPNRLTVTLTDVAWDIGIFAGPGYLRLDPVRYSDFLDQGKPIVIPDFEVQHVPYSYVRYIHSLGPAKSLTA